jgi:hypothetical protein
LNQITIRFALYLEFTFLSVEAPVWQDADVQEYQHISSFCHADRQDASALKNVILFLREP